MDAMSSLFFLKPTRIEENCRQIKAYAGSSPSKHVIEALSDLQGGPRPSALNSRHRRISESDLPSHRWVIGELMGGNFPDSFALTLEADFQNFTTLSSQAEELWRRDFPHDFQSYENLIASVVYAYRDSYTGGSNSNCIGWIWLSPEQDWSVQSFLENLVHEYTHNVLFLEEMVHTTFAVSGAAMAAPENHVISAIRRTPRFFDQSYHAAAVAIVLIELYLRQTRIAEAKILLEGLLLSLEALVKRRDLLTGHGEHLLSNMVQVALHLYEGSEGASFWTSDLAASALAVG